MLKHPYLRQQLITTLRILADWDYQYRAWVQHDFPEPIKYDCFDYAIHLLFDDTPLAEDPEREVGFILKDETEVEAVRQVVKAVDNVLNTLGTEASDEEYIRCPEWNDVIAAATTALKVFKSD